MKRMIAFFLCLCLGGSLAGCTKEKVTSVPETSVFLEETAAVTPETEAAEGETNLEAVLKGYGTFYFIDFETEVTIEEFCSLWGEHSAVTITTPKYAAVDMDGDGTQELIFKIMINDVSEYGVEVIHWEKGRAYGYTFSERQLGAIKEDGSFWYSGSEGNDGSAKIKFSGESYSFQDISPEQYDSQKDILWLEYLG